MFVIVGIVILLAMVFGGFASGSLASRSVSRSPMEKSCAHTGLTGGGPSPAGTATSAAPAPARQADLLMLDNGMITVGIDRARGTGYTETMLGRRRYLPDLTSDVRQRREMAERMALNAPIQGSAADIIRRAMIRMPGAIAGLPAKMLLQVHDELLFEVDEGAADTLAVRAKAVMEEAAHPAVRAVLGRLRDGGTEHRGRDRRGGHAGRGREARGRGRARAAGAGRRGARRRHRARAQGRRRVRRVPPV